MRYNGIFGILIIVFFIIFLNSSLNIILISNVKNEKINVVLKIEYFFNIIKIKVPIYPRKKKYKRKSENKKVEGESKRILRYDIFKVYSMIKMIPIEEIYSDINFGCTNINFTCFIHLLINFIYGNVLNLFESERIYLNVMPNFTSNYVIANLRIHIKPKIITLIRLIFITIEIFITSRKKIKEGKKNERTWINKKSYGDNS